MAFNDFLVSISRIYKEFSDRNPGASTDWDAGEVSGPFIRFVQACVTPLNIEKTATAIRRACQNANIF
jgi:hypothetical protein